MKKTKKWIGLMWVAVLTFALLNIPALAVDPFYASAAPVRYDFYVDGESVSMWAYKIDGGGVYFKLRDLAAVLNGSEKQFEVSWDGGKKAVSLTTGAAYTPVGGELSEASGDMGAVAAYPPATSFYIDDRRIPIRAYLVNDAHYIQFLDLAVNIRFSTAIEEEKHFAKINTETYDTGLYSLFFLPEGWRAEGSVYDLQFSRSGEPVGSLIIRNYDPDKPISQFEDNHRTTLSSENLNGFSFPAAKALIRATQPAAAQDDSYVDELHIYLIPSGFSCAFDFCFDSAKVGEQTALEIAKNFRPDESAIIHNTLASRWAQAVRDREGRAQYGLMNKELQADYYDYYDSHHWVTGVSSPWVNSWTIEISGNSAVVFYENMTSTGFAGYTIDTLTFSEEDGQLKISSIDGYHAQFAATGSTAGDATAEIFENVNSQLDTDIEFTNGWRSSLVDVDENGEDGKYIIVQAGSLKSDPEQGVAVVCHQNKGSDQYIIDERFLTPGKHGAIKIQSLGAKDFTMSVVAEDSYTWLFNIYNGFSAESVLGNFHIALATDELLNKYDSFHEYINDEDGAELIIWTDIVIKDFAFIAVDHDDAGGKLSFLAGDALFSVEELSPEKPFVVKLVIPGSIPAYGISFADENGAERFFSINLSGRGANEASPYYLLEENGCSK